MAYFKINTEEKKSEYDMKDTGRRSSNSYWQNSFTNNLRTDSFYSTNGRSFVFTASVNSPGWPFEIYYQDLANMYSSLCRNRLNNRTRQFDPRHSLGFFVLLLIFIFLNLLI